jgi:hypothetical protein
MILRFIPLCFILIALSACATTPEEKAAAAKPVTFSEWGNRVVKLAQIPIESDTESSQSTSVQTSDPVAINPIALKKAVATPTPVTHKTAAIDDEEATESAFTTQMNTMWGGIKKLSAAVKIKPVTTDSKQTDPIQNAPIDIRTKYKAPSHPLSNAPILKPVLGMHGGYSRLSLPLPHPAIYHFDLDNTEKVLLVEFPDKVWQTGTVLTGENSPIIQNINIEQKGDVGSLLVIQLKQPTQILKNQILPPNPKTPSYRLYFDLAHAE